MPPVVKAAYRNPIDLLGLLKSKAYSADDRRQVRDSLLDALTRDFGVVHLPHGDRQTRTIAQRSKSFKDTLRSIDLILSVEDYGGKDQTLSYLAEAMENRWQEWWQSVSWKTVDDTYAWRDISANVLGRRQTVWLAAQYARSVIDLTANRSAAVQAIEAAESWSVSPTEDNRKQAYVASYIAFSSVVYDPSTAYYASYSAGQAASIAADSACYFANAAYYPLSAAPENASRLCELTKQLITPSLVDAI
jgi:hypothetical protein